MTYAPWPLITRALSGYKRPAQTHLDEYFKSTSADLPSGPVGTPIREIVGQSGLVPSAMPPLQDKDLTGTSPRSPHLTVGESEVSKPKIS